MYFKINQVCIASGPCCIFVVSLSLRTHAFRAVTTVVCSRCLKAHCSVSAPHIFVCAAIFLYKWAPNSVEKLTLVTVVQHNPLFPIYLNRRFFYCGSFQKRNMRHRKGPFEVYSSKLHIKCRVIKSLALLHVFIFSSYGLEICIVMNAKITRFWDKMPRGRRIHTLLCICFAYNRPYRGRIGFIP